VNFGYFVKKKHSRGKLGKNMFLSKISSIMQNQKLIRAPQKKFDHKTIYFIFCCGVLDFFWGEFSHFCDEKIGKRRFFNLKNCQILVTRPKNQKPKTIVIIWWTHRKMMQ
jgi:hypothetical protein